MTRRGSCGSGIAGRYRWLERSAGHRHAHRPRCLHGRGGALRDVTAQPAVTCQDTDLVQGGSDYHAALPGPPSTGGGRGGHLCGILSLNDLALATPNPSHQQRGLRPEAVMATLTAGSERRPTAAA